MDEKPVAPIRRRRRWPFFLLALAAFLWFLPALAAWKPVRDLLLPRLLGGLPVRVEVESLSLGWLSPVSARGITVRDPEGEVLGTLASLSLDRSPWDLLRDRTDLGTLRLEGADLHVRLEGATSNLEKLLARCTPPPPPGPTPPAAPPAPLRLRIEATGSSVRIRDEARGLESVVEAVETTAVLHPAPGLLVEVEARGNLVAGSGSASWKGTAQVPAPGPSGELRAAVESDLSGLPAESFQAILERFLPDTKLAGTLAGSCKVDLVGDRLELDADLRGPRLETAGAFPHDERLVLTNWSLPCRMRLEGSRIRVDRFEAVCDLGKVQVKGIFDTAGDLLAEAARAGNRLHAEADIARLTGQLPRTLNLHPDLRLQSGQVTLTAQCVPAADGVALTARLRTRDLRGLRAERPVAWADPLDVTFRLHRQHTGTLRLEQVSGGCDFLKVDGRGTADGWNLGAQLDLEKLAGTAGQFVDLPALRCRGQATVYLTCKLPAADRFDLQTTVQMRSFRFEPGEGRSLVEPSLVLNGTFAGTRNPQDGAIHLSMGTARLTAGSDWAEVRLLDPLSASELLHGRFRVHLEGDLARWHARLDPWTRSLVAVPLAGLATVKGEMRTTPRRIEFQDVELTAQNFDLRLPGLAVKEPRLDLKARGAYALDRDSLALANLTLRCGTVNVDAVDVAADFGARGGPSFSAGTSLAGDLAKLQRWLDGGAGPAPTPLSGQVVGRLGIRWAADGLGFDGDVALRHLVLGPPAQPAFSDPLLKVAAKGAWIGRDDLCRLDRFRLESRLLAAEAQGQVQKLSGAQDVYLVGKLTYDLEKAAPLLKPYLGAEVRIAGRDSRQFSLAGPLRTLGKEPVLTLASLQGQADLHWDALQAYGARVGPANLHLRLTQGTLHLPPFDALANGGKLRVGAALRMEPGPMELSLVPGSNLQRAKLTPELCASALGYAAPTLANATEVQGEVSVQVAKGRMPLAFPEKAEVQGTFILHDARLAPGPMVKELTNLLKYPPKTALVKEAQVPFALVDGKVHHRDLELIFPELTIRSAGWVALDGTLSLLLEMPIPPRWLGNNPRLNAALANQKITLPLRGTLSQPRLDERAVREASGRFVRDAAGDVLQQEIENRLKKLLGPK